MMRILLLSLLGVTALLCPLHGQAEEARAAIGDYNRVGENMRFFDPMDQRPEKPVFTNLVRKPRKKKPAANKR